MRQTLSKIVKILDGQPTGRRGQSLVEMALTTPLLILMVLSLVEIGFFANDYLILLDAIRSASRVAVNLDPTNWNYGDAHNQNRMDCDTDEHNTIGPGTGAGSIYNQYPVDSIQNPAIPGIAYGQRADPDQDGGYAIAQGPRGMHLAAGGTFVPRIPFKNVNPFTGVGDGGFGFFDAVACQVIVSMQPLHLQDYLTASGTDQYNADGTPFSKDDVVVSAVSYVTRNYNGLGNNGPNYASDIGTPHAGYYVTVTGRWPIESRYCYANGQGDVRDPFDFLRSDYHTTWTDGNSAAKNVDGTSHDNQPSGTPKQWEGPVIDRSDPNRDPLIYPDWRILDAKTLASDTQGVRGYMFTGNHQTSDGSNCFGSDFRVQDIEQSLNLAYDGVATDPNLNKSAPNGGVVIVEVFWQYHPLFFGPLFQGFNSGNKQKDPIIHVWSFYPIPGLEPTPTPKG